MGALVLGGIVFGGYQAFSTLSELDFAPDSVEPHFYQGVENLDENSSVALQTSLNFIGALSQQWNFKDVKAMMHPALAQADGSDIKQMILFSKSLSKFGPIQNYTPETITVEHMKLDLLGVLTEHYTVEADAIFANDTQRLSFELMPDPANNSLKIIYFSLPSTKNNDLE